MKKVLSIILVIYSTVVTIIYFLFPNLIGRFGGGELIGKVNLELGIQRSEKAKDVVKKWVHNYAPDEDYTRAIMLPVSDVIKGLENVGAIRNNTVTADANLCNIFIYFARYSGPTGLKSDTAILKSELGNNLRFHRAKPNGVTTILQFANKDTIVAGSPVFNLGDVCPENCPKDENLY